MDTELMSHLRTDPSTNHVRIPKRIPYIEVSYVDPANGEFRLFIKDITFNEERDWLLRLTTWAAHQGVELRIRQYADKN